jgi:diguanylate cyclase (GGDEF)-like protein
MPGLLDERSLERVFNAWRRAMRHDPLLSRASLPELTPFAKAFNDALTGDGDNGELAEICATLSRGALDASTVVRITTFLAETFADEVGASSGAVRRSLVSTLGYICGLMVTTMVSDVALLARRDTLTGLENRRAWDEAMELHRDDVTIGIVDLDGLKRINDAEGHEAGDAYIKRFAAALRTVVSDPVRAYRFGGDEFGIMTPGDFAQEMETVLQDLLAQEGIAPFSFGIAHAGEARGDNTALFELADSRMYEMKESRKGQANQPI